MDRLNSQSGEGDKGERRSSVYGFKLLKEALAAPKFLLSVFFILRLQPVHSVDGRFGERWQSPLSGFPSLFLTSSAAPQTVRTKLSCDSCHIFR